jgi:HK97 family phage portal protein
MGILDIFKRKNDSSNESNTLFGQTALGNQVVLQGNKGKFVGNNQLLYVTTSSTTVAGRTVDVSVLSRNSTVMSCVGVKARTLAQLPKCVMYKTDDGTFVDALKSDKVGKRDKDKARQINNLLNDPNNFQSSYEFFYQLSQWLDLTGETFTVLWRENQTNPMQSPIEMYNLDSTLITAQLTPTRYPSYRLSTSSYGFNENEPLDAHQVIHIMDQSWQGAGGFNKGILATELVALDQDIDLYANFVMQNGAKPSGIFSTTQVIPDAKYKEVAQRLKETWNAMTGGRSTDLSKAGQGMLLDQGMTYTPVNMLTLQDADARELKLQTMRRICALFGVPPQMVGISEGKFNNTQTMLDEFGKTTMYPMIINIEQKFKQSLLKGYPNLHIRFDTKDFLKGAPLDQMNFVTAAVSNGIMTPNEAREYMNMAKIDGADELKSDAKATDPIPGSSKQDTGGGGGNQTRKMNIGK